MTAIRKTAAEQDIRKREGFYRIYYLLMNLCLVAAAIGLADWIRDDIIRVQLWRPDHPLYLMIGSITLIFSFIVGPILVVGRPLRDEYAQQLWVRTSTTMAYVLAIAPPVIQIGAWLGYLASGSKAAPKIFAPLYRELVGWDFMILAWMTFLLLFVGIFQFLRWKDSR